MALVKIVEGELTVVDHEGDNYLGGSDFDKLLVEKIIVPEISRRGRFTDLLNQMKSEQGKYNKLWYRLLHSAEAAKIELSTSTSAEIDLGMVKLEDEDGKSIESLLTIYALGVRGGNQGGGREDGQHDEEDPYPQFTAAEGSQVRANGGRKHLHPLYTQTR